MYSVVGALIILVTTSEACFGAFSGSPAYRKQQARTQYETAERMREALNGRPADERTRKAYQKVADAYRKVYYVSPASSKADASMVAVAEILAEMGRQFAPDDKDLHAAIAQYEFLRREYPGSKYRVEALFTIGQLYKEDLGDEAAAKATFEEFLRKYPRSRLAPKAQEALAELNQPKAKKKPEVAARVNTSQPSEAEVGPVKAPASPRVTGIRYWSTADYTRVAIDLDGEVKYESGRVPDPDRIFFDLPDTRLVSTLVGKSFDVQDGFLKKIRIAQYQKASTRVVLEVDDVTEYSAFLLPNPYRLIIDIHGTEARGATKVQDNLPPVSESNQSVANAAAPDQGGGSKARSKATVTASAAPDAENAAKTEQKVAAKTSATKTAPTTKTNASTGNATPDASAATTTTALKNAKGELTASNTAPPHAAPWTARPAQPVLTDDAEAVAESPVKPTTKPTTAPTAVNVAPDKKKGKKASTSAASDAPAAHEAMPTSSGDRSLIRALGLKIGRIVIDAGHGGHDTGTIGPNGLEEKDLVLDVSLRLGRLLQSKLGAEVIYTRDDDTFIPLETRTAIANEHQADLFISVHANSSQDETARGVETYYLNFTSNPDALEVAARENAVSEKSIHELQDLVKKITLKEKIDESRELASDVQQSLYAGLSPKNPTLRNRGVKKAPFVVLIGANMPSILAEISFVSNPTDEKKLETPEYRQKIAESLYKGIAKYISGLSGLKVASKQLPVAGSQ